MGKVKQCSNNNDDDINNNNTEVNLLCWEAIRNYDL
jgi:hypothetical protein